MAERNRGGGRKTFNNRNHGGGTSRQNSSGNASGNYGQNTGVSTGPQPHWSDPPPSYTSLAAGYPLASLPFPNQSGYQHQQQFQSQPSLLGDYPNQQMSNRGNWAGRSRGNYQRGGQHGNQSGNQHGNRGNNHGNQATNYHQGHNQQSNYGNQAADYQQNDFGNYHGNQFGGHQGNQFGGHQGNQFGGHQGNQRGQQSNQRGQQNNQRGQQSNQRGQQSNQRGQQSNQRGQQSNQRGQQSNQRGQQSNQRGQQSNQQGQQSNQKGQQSNQQGQQNNQQGQQNNHQRGQQSNQRGKQNTQRGNRAAGAANNREDQRNEPSTSNTSVDSKKQGGFSNLFSNVIDFMTRRETLEATVDVISAVNKVINRNESPKRKPRYRSQNAFVRPPTPEVVNLAQTPGKSQRRRRPNRNQLTNQWKQKRRQQQQRNQQNPGSEPPTPNLLSFVRSSSVSASNLDLSKDDSSDTDESVFSTSSGYSTVTTTSERVGEIDEELSRMGYEVIGDDNVITSPVNSWLQDQKNYTNPEPTDAVIGVFWDIENCAVPSGKSAHDIVKKIRNTFYKGRREETFLVVCDTKNIPKVVLNELNNFQVRVEHVESDNKNASDEKLKSSLIEFAMNDKPRGSSVVLITGDCDFTSVIHTLRYKKKIHVILLHHKTARKELVDMGNETFIYEEFVKGVVEKYFVLMENIPSEGSNLRTVLPLLVLPYQGRVEYPKSPPNQVLLIFPAEEKANEFLIILENGQILTPEVKITRQPKIKLPEVNAPKKSPSKSKQQQQQQRKNEMTDASKPKMEMKRLSTSSMEKTAEVNVAATTGSKSEDQGVSTEEPKKKSKKNKKKKAEVVESLDNVNTVVTVEPEKPLPQAPIKHSCQIVLENTGANKFSRELWIAYFKEHLDEHSFVGLELRDNKLILGIEGLALAKRLKRKLEKLSENTDESFKVLSLIRNTEQLSTSGGSESNFNDMLRRQKIKASLAEISKKVSQFIKNHEKALREKDCELQALKKMDKAQSNAKPENFRKFMEIRETIESKKTELRNQFVIFENHLDQKIKQIEAIPIDGISSDQFDAVLREAMIDFGRECSAFKEALPIYAHKSRILETIKKRNVVVLLAETGSGKSTQVTQYLCQAGYARNGIIICTQPRKIAARSLAQHVSSQYGCKPGTEVSFQINQSRVKQGGADNRKIVYSTDHSLLNECIKNPHLRGYSCVIVDEAHERSIFTDILLGMLQKILKVRDDLKLIITSATIDPKIFTTYFGISSSDALLNVPGRTYPIDIVWAKTTVKANYDYLEESVTKAMDIHREEQPGHILSFLPTPAETQKACKMFEDRMKSNGTYECLPLHGKLSPEEQNKIFEPSAGKRKVIFATNCAETSITITGVRYVIDCGLAKELHFDPIKQSSCLKIVFISQSSANQRKGRAGRTEAGKCYRLYSEENYSLMETETKPEILRVNLGQALLKLMDLGIEDPCQFQFVQSPPLRALRVAMNSLERLGAVTNGTKLTQLGVKMSKLPVEPRLAKLAIRGQEEGIGYECLIVAALSSVSGIIFFRVDDNQMVADAKKVTFSREEGDFHTFLEVFSQWQRVSAKNRSAWCVQNCINGKSMKIAEESVKELVQVFERDLNIELDKSFSEEPSAMETLQFLIFEAFYDNLSVFSGQRNSGYFTYPDGEQVHVHPSSCLNYLGKLTPGFIIFDTKLTTTRNFIMNIVPVSEDMISRGYQMGIVKPGQIEEMKAMMFGKFTMGPFGKTVSQHLTGPKGRRRRELEDRLKRLANQESLSLEINFESGLVEVFSHSRNTEIIKNEVLSCVEQVLSTLRDEQRQLGNDLHECRYILGAGMTVKGLLMPGEYRKIRVKNFIDSDFDSIINNLRLFGAVRSFRKLRKEILVTMETSQMASDIVDHFKKKPITPGNNIIVVPDGDYKGSNQNRPMYRVRVSWCRRPSAGYGFLNFNTTLEYMINARQLLSTGHVTYKGRDIKFRSNKKQSQDSLHVAGLPHDANEDFVRSALATNYPEVLSTIKDISVIRCKEFVTTDEELKLIESRLTTIFAMYTKRDNIIVDMIKPRPKSMEYRAFVSFHNAGDGDVAVRSLKSLGYTITSTVDNKDYVFPLNLEAEIHSSILCRKDLFEFLSDQVKTELTQFEKAKVSGDRLSVEAKDVAGTNLVRLEIFSNNLREMETLFKIYTELLKGYVLQCKGKSTLEKLFTDYGNNYLQDLARIIGCKIYCDYRQKQVSVHALSDAALTKTQIEINKYLNRIEAEASKEMYLISNRVPKGFTKLVLKHYGSDLEGLVAEHSLTHVDLNIRRHVITMHGNKTSIESAERELKTMMEACAEYLGLCDEDDDIPCPICFCSPEEPYRLETCGHSYCKECINSLLNTKEIPVVCSKEGCGLPLVMRDFKTLLDNDEDLDLVLQEAALEHFVAKNPTLYSFCPTPDCPVVYKKSENNSEKNRIFECPKCSVKICRRCQTIEHIGMDCDFYQLYKDDKDFSIRKWIALNPENRKQCPNCKMGIEKNGGCTHMTCRNCSTHMCWRCLRTFGTGQEVYNHQPFCLGATQFE